MLMVPDGMTLADGSWVASTDAVGALPDWVAAVVGVGSLPPEATGVAVAEDPQATNKTANNRIKPLGQWRM